MRLYEIIDEYSRANTPIAYLFYYEKQAAFSIEIAPNLNPKSIPLFFATFVEEGKMTVDMEWSKRWVKGRIIPEERQNIGMVLRDNHINSYDLMALLQRGMGRCAQDDLMIRLASQSKLPTWLTERQKKKIRMAFPLDDFNVLVCFYDDSIRRIDLRKKIEEDRSFLIFERKEGKFFDMSLQPGGNGIMWDEWLFIPAADLYSSGKAIALSTSELLRIMGTEIIDTSEACRLLGCSRQYINQLVKKELLPTADAAGSRILYYRSDVERLRTE